jgi:pSer/pThr/pTyr-binding forkhead associated (FHA) protein
LQGPRQGQRLPVRHGFTIGKAPDCDFVLEGDSFASSHHARIHMDASLRCSLVDLHSTNGTFVNGVRAMEEKRLVGGEAIRVGAMEMRFLQQ